MGQIWFPCIHKYENNIVFRKWASGNIFLQKYCLKGYENVSFGNLQFNDCIGYPFNTLNHNIVCKYNNIVDEKVCLK